LNFVVRLDIAVELMSKLHDLAYEGNIPELRRVVPGPHFDKLNDRDQSVLYCACRSAKTSPELVQLLIDEKRCTVTLRNGPLGMGSTAPHGIVESLRDLVYTMHSTQDGVLLAQRLLSILHLLKSRQADMLARNDQNLTALQEFQNISLQMSSCVSVASLVSDFTDALCPFLPSESSASDASISQLQTVPILSISNNISSQQFQLPPSHCMSNTPPPVFPPPPLSGFPHSIEGSASQRILHPQSGHSNSQAASGVHDMGFDPPVASPAMEQSGGNDQATIERILGESQPNQLHETGAAADSTSAHEAALADINLAPSLYPESAQQALAPPLPAVHSEYTLELTTDDYNALMMQCIMDPPDTCTAVVACCHRLPPSIQKDIRHGSRILEMSLLNSSRKLIYEFKQMTIPLSQLQTIASVYSDCQSVQIKFSCDVLPAYVPFNVPDSFSQCCMAIGCTQPLKKGGRHHCRCCGLLFCSSCSDFKISHPSRDKQRVCKSCHTLFAGSPSSMWRPEWVISKRDEVFVASCERLTTALDIIEKMPHAARLGLDVTRLWSSDDPEFRKQLRLLQRSHPDAQKGEGLTSSTDFGQLQASCAKLLDRLSTKELLYQSQFASSSEASTIIDNSCNVCHQLFSFFASKHYCRVCGLAVCSRVSCCKSKSTILPPNFGYGSNPVSVCMVCCATLVSTLAPSNGESFVSQQLTLPTHPRVLWRDAVFELFERASAVQPQAALPCASQLQVVCRVDNLNPQTARLTIFFCPSLVKDSAVVNEHFGRLQASVTRPFSAFESFRKCLLNQGYPSNIVPQLNSLDVFGCDRFMNAVFQHRRLRNSSLIPLFCASSDEWGEELHRVLMRVSQGTDSTLLGNDAIKSSPPTLPWSAVQQMIRVLRCHGAFAMWAPLAIKFFSLSEFLENNKIGSQKLQEREALFHARLARFAERSKRHESFCTIMHEKTALLRTFLTRSCDRLSREQSRLMVQNSTSHPILTRRRQDLIDRESDFRQFELISNQIEEEYANFRARKQNCTEDRAQNLLIQEMSRASLISYSSSNPHVEWLFDTLSSHLVGLDSISLLQAIKDEEEQLAEHKSVLRAQLHAESKDLEDEHQNLQSEFDDLCDEERESGAVFTMTRLNECMASLHSSLNIESETYNKEVSVRIEKERRLVEELDEVGRKIQACENLRKQRLDSRDQLDSQMKALSDSIKNVLEQLMAAVPLIQQAQQQSFDIERALRLLLDTQSHDSFRVVLQPVRETLDAELKNIISIKDSANVLLSQKTSVFDGACMILAQVISGFVCFF
jgi:hypothetical protein